MNEKLKHVALNLLDIVTENVCRQAMRNDLDAAELFEKLIEYMINTNEKIKEMMK